GQAVVTTNTAPASGSYTMPDGHQIANAAFVDVAVTGHPNGLSTRTYFGDNGLSKGLPLGTLDMVNSAVQRWSWTDWTNGTQSLPGPVATYQLNPRVTETVVGDGSNIKGTKLTYYSFTEAPQPTTYPYNLAEKIEVYDTVPSSVRRRTQVSYLLSSEYTAKNLIGLATSVQVSGWNSETEQLELASHMTYGYDEGDFLGPNQIIWPIQFDANGDSHWILERGNLTSITRNDVTGQSATVTSTVKYNVTGAPISRTDPLGRVVGISYNDVWNSTGDPTNTYAYPTMLTDPNGQSSTVKYRYDIGANVEATSPAPAGQTDGKTSKRTFDSIGRLERDSVYVSTAEQYYTRYAYPSNGVQSLVYSTLVDVNSSGGPDTADEVLSESWFDGAGRVRLSRTEHPGSVGGYSGSLVEYDILGRVKRQTVPTEINSSWNPAGDDYRGMNGSEYIWLWTSREYDWKGRPVKTVPTDSTGTDGKETIIEYVGCGCAGGQITTVKGPVTTAVDVSGTTQTAKRRWQKAYEDTIGRTYKTEILDLDGASVYSTVKTKFNSRDQPTLISEYEGADSSSTYQDTIMTYDGHGRLKTSHKPEQRDGSTLKYTTYNYNPDDSILNVTDARGAMTHYEYNSRGLPVELSWTVPYESGITVPATVGFDYDNAGNRTLMTDGLGNVNYTYNSLSQLESESRYFNDLPSAPYPNNRYTLSYTYTSGGQLKSYTDPGGREIEYEHDKTGRLAEVNGMLSSVPTSYASNASYRAWGALKHLEYGNGTEMNAGGFNDRLQATSFEVSKDSTEIISKAYEFYSDGTLKKETDNLNGKFHRLYNYDHVGRMKFARSGVEASGGSGSALNIPFKYDFQYDAFNNQTQNQYAHYTRNGTVNLEYTNNRITSWGQYASPSTYDFDGNLTTQEPSSPNKVYKYDASGRMSGTYHENCGTPCVTDEEVLTYDGNGVLVKTATSHTVDEEDPETDATYTIRSMVLNGEVISTQTHTKAGVTGGTYVRAAGTVVAYADESGPRWMHKDPAMTSLKSTYANGQVISYGLGTDDFQPHELDPMGKSLGFEDPYAGGIPEPYPEMIEPLESFGSLINGQWTTYTIDGIQVPKSHAGQMAEFFHGNVFGQVERAAALSAPRLVGNFVHSVEDGIEVYETTEQGMRDAYRTEMRNPTWHRVWAVSDNSWAANAVFGGQQQTGRDARLVGLEKHRQKISAQLNRMSTAACEKAFRDANLHTPNEVTGAGLTIFDSSLLNSPTNNRELGMSDNYRKEMMEANAGSNTINDVTSPWGQGNNGMLFMALTPRSFTGLDRSFEEIFTHAMMHAAGALGRLTHPETSYSLSRTPGQRFPHPPLKPTTREVPNSGGQHDLTWMDKKLYDAIIKNCTK
ncbi:MAG: hypothetical protein AB7J13_09200, partial [Pyrinomonadaceae bacterium]